MNVSFEKSSKIIPFFLIIIILLAVVYFVYVSLGGKEPVVEQNNENNNEQIVGGDKDEHGCIGSAGYTWCEEKQKCLRIWEEACGEKTTSVNITFTETGNLTRQKNSQGNLDWFFVYEKAGSPALSKMLSFTSESACDLGSGYGLCTRLSDLNIGDKVKVEGEELIEENIVTVDKLTAVK